MTIPERFIIDAAEHIKKHDEKRRGSARRPPPRPAPAPVVADDLDQADEVEADELTTYERIDLGDVVDGILAGTINRPKPTVGTLTDGDALFYESRINSMFGNSGEGKTMVCQTIAVQEISAGFDVLWIDLEDDEIGAVARLIDLGADPDDIRQRFHYLRPDLPTCYAVWPLLTEMIAGGSFRLAVLDSLGEFMALEGVKDEDGPVATMMRGLPLFLSNAGLSVVTIDHVTKIKENGPKGFAVGSHRKRAAVRGAAYEVIQYRALAKGVVGALKLVVAKDRGGHRPRGATAAEITVDGMNPPAIAVTFDPPTTSTDSDGNFRPTALMAKASRWLEQNPGEHSKRTVIDAVVGNRSALSAALDRLVAEGFASMRQDGQAHLYQHVERFTDD